MNVGIQVTTTSATDLMWWYFLPSGLINPSDKSSGKAWQHEKYSTFFHSSTLQKPRLTFHYVMDCLIVNKAPPLSLDLTLGVLFWWISFSVIDLPSFLRPKKSRCLPVTDKCSSDSALHAEFVSEHMHSAAFKQTKRTSLDRSRTLIPVPAWIQLVRFHSGRFNIDFTTIWSLWISWCNMQSGVPAILSWYSIRRITTWVKHLSFFI